MIYGGPCEDAPPGTPETSEEHDSRCAADAGLDEGATRYNFATGMWSDDGNT